MAVFPSRKIVLPQRINFVNYIQSSGTQRIDTEVYPNQDTRVYVKATVPVDGNTNWLFGVRTSSSASDRFGFVASQSRHWQTMYERQTGNFDSSIATSNPIIIDKIKNRTQIFIENAPDTYTNDLIYKTFQSSLKLPLFAGMTGSSYTYGRCKLYWCEIYSGDTLIRDFRPCLDEDGVACLYDMVSKQYFRNAGTGTFAYG